MHDHRVKKIATLLGGVACMAAFALASIPTTTVAAPDTAKATDKKAMKHKPVVIERPVPVVVRPRPPRPVPPPGWRPPVHRPIWRPPVGWRPPRRGIVIRPRPIIIVRPAWAWNHGVTWVPRPTYWGGGFWGPLALTAGTRYYLVPQTAPGWNVLNNYGLTQTPCYDGQIVQIVGPQNSMICAWPNQYIGPGYYSVSLGNLTLTAI